jgi:hypothetical protein
MRGVQGERARGQRGWEPAARRGNAIAAGAPLRIRPRGRASVMVECTPEQFTLGLHTYALPLQPTLHTLCILHALPNITFIVRNLGPQIWKIQAILLVQIGEVWIGSTIGPQCKSPQSLKWSSPCSGVLHTTAMGREDLVQISLESTRSIKI